MYMMLSGITSSANHGVATAMTASVNPDLDMFVNSMLNDRASTSSTR